MNIKKGVRQNNPRGSKVISIQFKGSEGFSVLFAKITTALQESEWRDFIMEEDGFVFFKKTKFATQRELEVIGEHNFIVLLQHR